MTHEQYETLYDAIFAHKINCEDNLDLERAGHETGFKKGYWRKELTKANKAFAIIESLAGKCEEIKSHD